jgi:hypothetical protein
MDYNNIDEIIDGIEKITNLPTGGVMPVPIPLIIFGTPQRSGLSSTKIAQRIISRKPEAGLKTGVLPSGALSSDEKMEIIRIEELIKALQEECVITIAFSSGITVAATGANAGGPVTVVGTTTTPFKGYGIIQ